MRNAGRICLLTVLVVAFTLLIAAGSSAADASQSFAGSWSFDPSQSKGVGMMAEGTIVTTIKQTKKEIVVDDVSVFQGQSSTQHTVYDVSGSPVTNTSMMAGQATTRSRWVGARLVTEWESAGTIAGSVSRRTETRYLSPDGRTMYLESARAGSEPMLIVFVRGR